MKLFLKNKCEMIGCKRWAKSLAKWFDGTPIWVCKSCRDYHMGLGSIIDHNQPLNSEREKEQP
jgi:hypothetical protein